jgi:ribosomal protein S18 acetylase RimI-like enzyme
MEILLVDYADAQHAQWLVNIHSEYARDPMGGGEDLSKEVKENLVTQLSKVPGAFSLIAVNDGIPVAYTNCLMGFSTFAAKPLINVHDIYVHADFRGQGLSHQLLAEVEKIAHERQCCKITLEVLSNNVPAKASYNKFGFSDYQLDPSSGSALFWQKKL